MAIRYTKGEERTNTWSHAGGAVLGILIGVLLLQVCWQAGSRWAVFGVSLYLFGMLSSYLCSAIYHGLPARSVWKERLRRFDHAAIYWHIAGSYSPLVLTVLREEAGWGWGLFAFVWTCAAVGTVLTFRNLKEHSNLETLCYIGMGLSIVAAFRPLMESVRLEVLWWIAGEGLCFITGALFYSMNRRRYMHSVFHFFVLGGSFCHIWAVWIALEDYLS